MTNPGAQFLARVKATLISATRSQGDEVVEAMKPNIPVQSGTLRDATKADVIDMGQTVRLVVENTCPYAAHVEYGHVARGQDHETHVPGRPFMRQSYYDQRQNYVRRIRGEMR